MFTAVPENQPRHFAGKDRSGDTNIPTILYLHVPKAAGTTLSVILEPRYDKERILNLPDTKRAMDELAKVPEDRRAQLQFVRGHFAFGVHQCLRQPFEYITILRDPVERLISHYYYVLRNPKHYLYSRVTSDKMGIKEYALGRLSRELDNGQVRQISGEYYRDPRGECSPDLLERAKANLRDHFAVVGLAERFDETMLLLSERFGWKDMYYVRQNVTRDRPRREQLSGDEMEAIRSVSSLDIELYAFATELFENAVRKQDPSAFNLKLVKYRQANEAYSRKSAKASPAQHAL